MVQLNGITSYSPHAISFVKVIKKENVILSLKHYFNFVKGCYRKTMSCTVVRGLIDVVDSNMTEPNKLIIK